MAAPNPKGPGASPAARAAAKAKSDAALAKYLKGGGHKGTGKTKVELRVEQQRRDKAARRGGGGRGQRRHRSGRVELTFA